MNKRFSDRFMLSRFLGEGRTGRVFSLKRLNRDQEEIYVVKIFKNQKYFDHEQRLMDKLDNRRLKSMFFFNFNENIFLAHQKKSSFFNHQIILIYQKIFLFEK